MNLRIEEWVFVIKNIKKRKENEIVQKWVFVIKI